MDSKDSLEKSVPKVEIIKKQESFTSLRNLGSFLGLQKLPSDKHCSNESLINLPIAQRPMESLTHLEREKLLEEQHNKEKE